MRFDRKLYIVAMVIFAVFLFASNVCAATITFTVTNDTGGTITPTGSGSINPSGGYVATGDGPHPFVMAPESNYQIVDVIVSEGKKKTYHVLPDCNDNDDGGDCSTIGGVATYEFATPQNDWTIEVTFAAIPVVANFVTDQPSGSEAGISVQFTDTSEYIDSIASQNTWNWDFGDNATSTEQNPVHTFAVGIHNVTLTVMNLTTNTTDSFTLEFEAIQPKINYNASAGPNGSISPSGDFDVDEGSTTTFTITPDTHYQVADVLVDGVSIGAVPSITFDVSDIADHTIAASFEPIPVIAGFSSDLASGNITTSDPVQFTDNSQNNPVSWLWDFGDGNTSTEQNPSYTFANDGTFTVTLTVGNALTTDMISAAYTVDPSAPPGIVKLEGASKEYEHLQDAYDDVLVSETIKLSADEPIVPLDVDGNLYFNRNVTVILKGGYDNNFETFNGFSRIHGNVIISDGIVEMSEVIIAPAPAI